VIVVPVPEMLKRVEMILHVSRGIHPPNPQNFEASQPRGQRYISACSQSFPRDQEDLHDLLFRPIIFDAV
jgi:hypothetical protein